MKKEHWALLSLGINTLQALAKLIAGLLTGSLSMIGESLLGPQVEGSLQILP